MRRRGGTRGGAALAAALAALVVSVALVAALAELATTELLIARNRLAAAAALAEADACVAAALASLPPGWDFDALLAGADGVAGTPDDGVLPLAPATCTATAAPAPGPAAPPRALVTVEARARGGRRAVEAIVRRAAEPGMPALLWLATSPAPGAVGGTLALDGGDARDPSAPPWAAVAAPAAVEVLDAWLAGEAGIVATPATAPPWTAAPPPLTEIERRVRTAAPAAPSALVAAPATPPVALTFAPGNLDVTGALRGAGLLFVGGTLAVDGTLDYAGLVIAGGGLRVPSGGRLIVAGALWVGAPPAAGPALDVDGQLALGRDRAALDAADHLLDLPRRPVLAGQRDLG